MSEFGPDAVDQVIEACQTGASEAAEAFARALDADRFDFSPGKPGRVDMQALPEGFGDAGLAVLLTVGEEGALVAIPEKSGLLPAWYENPDPTGQSKLTTLAQELGMILLPEEFMPTEFKSGRVKSLAGALGRGGVADGSPLIPLQLKRADGTQGTAALVWPATSPSAVFGAGVKGKPEPPPKAEAKKPPPKAKAAPEASGGQAKPASPPKVSLNDLPNYGRSLLRVKVPVVVTLAEKRQTLGQIVELGPGSIIQFDKSCEEMLDVHVGGRRVAQGEAVKVGEKFGLRVTSIVLPEERFKRVRPKG